MESEISETKGGLFINGTSKLNLEFEFAKKIPSQERRYFKRPPE